MWRESMHHLPLIGLVTDRVNELYDALPAIWKAIGFFGVVIGLYVGITNQNVRQDERLMTITNQLHDIRSTQSAAQQERHNNEHALQALAIKQAACEERLLALKEDIKRHLRNQK